MTGRGEWAPEGELKSEPRRRPAAPRCRMAMGRRVGETQQIVRRYRDCAPASARLESVLWDEIRWHRRD